MILLTTLNSQFVHSNLALRYLGGVLDRLNVNFIRREYTINQNEELILREIYALRPVIIAFSCYIWNIESTIRLADNLKKVMPEVFIIAGGPEVSYDAAEVLEHNCCFDLIVRGEGEVTFAELIEGLTTGSDWQAVAGITYRGPSGIVNNPNRPLLESLDDLPSAYGAENLEYERIFYYETSRGCPFNCSYCLSSTIRGVRYFSLDRVKQELAQLVEGGARQVKFVDRSFNCNPARALELVRFLAELEGEVRFHLELVGDRLTDELVEALAQAPEGRFQVEIGVQSLNADTLQAINRRQDENLLGQQVKKLMASGHVHTHLDLIAGLPYEDYESFKNSLDRVISWGPDYFQLGFLKLLKGTPIRQAAGDYVYIYQEHPPYEVLSNKWLDFGDVSRLKNIEMMLQKYYNSGSFKFSLAFLIEGIYKGSVFSFFEELAEYWYGSGPGSNPVGREKLYGYLRRFAARAIDEMKINSLLIFDFICNNPTLDVPKDLDRFCLPDQGKLVKKWLKDGNEEMNEPLVAGRYAARTSLNPRIEIFSLDILGLCGLQQPVEPKPHYPVLFRWEDGRCLVQYVQGIG